MRMTYPIDRLIAPIRRSAVAGSFYLGVVDELTGMVDRQLAAAPPSEEVAAASVAGLSGILVPHAGLAYSGTVAAAAWRLAASTSFGARDPSETGTGARDPSETGGAIPGSATTLVLLGTNHGAGWLTGVGIWDAGAWQTPLGDVAVDDELAAEVAALGPPFAVDREAHQDEHSIEVQLPFVRRTMPGARIVPLTVATGSGRLALGAGRALGALLAERRARGDRVGLAISTDMAHYPPATLGIRITEELAPFILGLEPERLAERESAIAASGLPGVACGMCGIQPAVVGLAALREMGGGDGLRLASATSADAGGPSGRTVGYLAVAFLS